MQMYLDPKDLNLAIQQDHYKISLVEEIKHELDGSTILLSWMVPHHTYVLSLVMIHPSWPLSTHDGGDTSLSASPLP